MRVPFIDLTREYREIKQEVHRAFEQVMKSGHFVLGNEGELFEKEFARYCGVPFAVSVNSGTDALFFSIRALGIGHGDEVILSANTFISCAYAISSVGAVPVFVDIDMETYNIDPVCVEAAVTKKTKAIIGVHMYGQIARMEELRAVAKKHSLFILEDASHAHGALYKKKRAGSFGDIGVFSLYPTKNMGVYGDGGIVTTRSKKIAENIRSLRNYGQTKKYHYEIMGYNSRLDELQAAFARIKLRYLDEWNRRRIAAARMYSKLLADVPVKLPVQEFGTRHVYYTFVIRTEKRDGLQEYLRRHGIETLVHYPVPIHQQTVFTKLKHRTESVHYTEHYSREIISLPLSPWITPEEIEYVCTYVSSYFSRH